MTCAVCNYRYRRRDGYATISLGQGETELEQLRSYQRFEVCGTCADVLRSWLGLPPELRKVGEDVVRPFSLCGDERLELS